MSGAKTYHRSYGCTMYMVEELSALVEVVPKGAVDDAEVRMLA